MFLLFLWVIEVNGFDVPLEVWYITAVITLVGASATIAKAAFDKAEEDNNVNIQEK